MAEAEDAVFLAKYPFLPAARSFVQAGGFRLGDLATDPSFERARRRAVQRLTGSLDKAGIPEAAPASEPEAVLELLSYPLARALAVAVGDGYLTSRYAVAESKLLGGRLAEEPDDVVWHVATELGLRLEPADSAYAKLHFLDYLRGAPGRDPAWKLVNQPLVGGYVTLAKDRAVRLAEEVYKERLLDELNSLERPGRAFTHSFEVPLNQVKTLVAAHRARFAPEAAGPIRVEAFPPCMNAVWNGIRAHVNVPHMGRFAIVSFLHTLGMSSDEILNFFSNVPDFDVSKSRYQIEHITGKIGATQYTPPSCATMQTYGICPLDQRDSICLNEIHHPLSYYRRKLRRLGSPKPSAPAAAPAPEVKGAPTPRGPHAG